MKKIIPLMLSGFLLMLGCKTTKETKETVVLTQAPFSLSLTNVAELGTDSLQSFVLGEANGYWLIFGGRTNGFHGTGGTSRTFPVQNANTKFLVYQPSTGQRFTASLPLAYQLQLGSTNMQGYQDGDTLWIAGGYGCNNGTSAGPCYQTYPSLMAINVSNLINAIIGGNTPNLGQYMVSRTDSRFQVTGGALRKIGDNFYLVMGHHYDSIYVDGVTGTYTEEIRRFNLVWGGADSIRVMNYQTWTDPQFHRRDLNILEAVRPNGQIGLNVFAGVFQPNAQLGAPWTNPVLIDEADNITTYQIDTTFNQGFNAYDCANVLMYDPGNQIMYTTLIGGITSFKLDSANNPIQAPTFLPWSNYVSTIAQFGNGTTSEFPQANPLLPGYVGAAGEVILSDNISLINGTTRVIDFSKLQQGDNLVGWMYGGILSTAEQTNAVSNPSFAVATIYEIHIMKQ